MLLAIALLAAPAPAAEGVYQESADGAPALSFLLHESDIDTVVAGAAITTAGGRTLETKCALPDGVASERLLCQSGDHLSYEDARAASVEAWVDGELATYEVIEVTLSRVQEAMDRRGAAIDTIEELEGGYYAAEAVWTGRLGGWVCQLEDSDFTACVSSCGGEAMVENLSTSAAGPTSSYFDEPACNVSCECIDGTIHTRTDPPQTLSL